MITENKRISDDALIARARATLKPRRINPAIDVGGVAAALLSGSGQVYIGVCIDASCSLGFCAEHAAIANMLSHGEDVIDTIVAVKGDGYVLPPCGRCREFIYQLDPEHGKTRVLLGARAGSGAEGGIVVKTIRSLMPDYWRDAIDLSAAEALV